MKISDEEVIAAVLESSSVRAAAIKAGISNVALASRIQRMRLNGIALPKGNTGPTNQYTPERVSELNEYINRKTQEINAREL
jgi:transposase